MAATPYPAYRFGTILLARQRENSGYALSGLQIRHHFVGPVSTRIAVTPYPAYRFYAVCQAR